MRFEKIIFGLALAGTAAFAAAGGSGFGGVRPGEGLELHLALALAAAMGMLFPHLWVTFFLLATGRGLRRLAAGRGGGGAGDAGAGEAAAGFDRLRRARRWAFGAFAAVAVAGAALLASGGSAFTGSALILGGPGSARAAASELHGLLFAVTLALQLAALAAEWRALRANAALFAAFGR